VIMVMTRQLSAVKRLLAALTSSGGKLRRWINDVTVGYAADKVRPNAGTSDARRSSRAASTASCRESVIAVIPGVDRTKKFSKLCLFSTYDADGVIDPHVFFHLDAISRSGFDIALISTSPSVSGKDVKQAQSQCRFLIHRQNCGLDFASWKSGLELIEDIGDYERILLANDSVFGPFCDLRPIFKGFEDSTAAVCGMTESLEQSLHLQSYFLYFKMREIPPKLWRQFWADVVPLDDKEAIVERYEVGLSQQLLAAGIELHAYIARDAVDAAARRLGQRFQYFERLNKDAFNSTWFMWDILLTNFRFPYLKTTILKRDPLHSRCLGRWREMLPANVQHSVVPLIDDYLRRTKNSLPDGP
jgi:hypothetical protein